MKSNTLWQAMLCMFYNPIPLGSDAPALMNSVPCLCSVMPDSVVPCTPDSEPYLPAGLGATLLGLQATVGLLVAKTLTNATANPFLAGGAGSYNPVLALDVFLVQVSRQH